MEAVVQYDYDAEQEDELNLKVGDVITNVLTAEGGWWEGELDGKKGMFPENFVSLVKKRDPPSKKEDKQIAAQRKSVRELANKFKDGVPMGAPSKKKEKKKRCKVLFDYTRENDDEITLCIGDIVDFHKVVEEGWWEGSVHGKHGVFPSNFVEMIEDSGPEEVVAPPSLPPKERDENIATDKDGDGFQSIKGKKVPGVGLGNIFADGPIKLRSTAESFDKEPPRQAKPSEPETPPEVTKREKAHSLERAVVRFSYNADQPDELSLDVGQIVHILDRELEDDGWWKGEVNGKVGVFPDNFVELISPEEPSKPKKPPPPSSTSSKHNLYPKLPEKAATAETEEKSKPEHSSSIPAIGKKPAAPPPIGKKPNAKPETSLPSRPAPSSVKDHKSENSLPSRPTASSVKDHKQENSLPSRPVAASVKDHKSSSLTKDSKTAPLLSKDNKSSSFPAPQKDNKSSSIPPQTRENHTVDNEQEGHFDGTETSSQKLTHLTANRPKGPKKRPPSTEVEMRDESPPPEPARPNHLSEKSGVSHVGERSHYKDRHPTHSNESAATNSISSHTETSSSGPPPRPPEPSSAQQTALNAQTNKLLEQLQRELQELKANSVSKADFNELKAENERLKQEFDNFKSAHQKKLRDVVLEVDEEKKLRLTTQVEIERVKKWMAETNV